MANYSEELLNAIRKDRKNGLTYNEIMLKHSLKSNNAIKIAMGKTLGGDPKYNGRHAKRFKELCEIERKYNKLVKSLKRLAKDIAILSEEMEDL